MAAPVASSAEDKPLVSIVTPAFNPNENLFQRCAESVLEQEYQRFEWLIVDDGSDDTSKALLEDVARRDDRIRLVSIAHGGVSAARNAGLDVSNGHFITFVDSDDQIAPLFLAHAVQELQSSHADIAYGRLEETSVEGMRAPFVSGGAHALTLAGDDLSSFRRFLVASKPLRGEDYYGIRPSTVAPKVYRASVVRGNRFRTDMAFSEDSLFGAEAAFAASSVVLVDEVWYRYVKNPQSASRHAIDGYAERTKASLEAYCSAGLNNGWDESDLALKSTVFIRNQAITLAQSMSTRELARCLRELMTCCGGVLPCLDIGSYEMSAQARLLCWLTVHRRALPLALLIKVKSRQ